MLGRVRSLKTPAQNPAACGMRILIVETDYLPIGFL
jgi:hypothetical protein